MTWTPEHAPPKRATAIGAGRYRLLARLGSGGMGDVFVAAAAGPMGFTKLVVIKTMRPPEEDSDPDLATMFFEEARVTARLNHPHIAQTFEFGQDGATYFIVMEYVEGQALSEVVRTLRKPLDPMLAAYVIDQLLDALHYAHELRDYDGRRLEVIHRDVSPQNVMITYGGEAKLVDFGIAKVATSETRTGVGVMKGKVSYMAPEQARAQTVDHRADVFAAGIVFWELLTGKRLITGGDHDARLGKLLFAPKPRLGALIPEIDPILDGIVAKALEMAPDDRFTSAKEMRDALATYLAKRHGRVLRDELAALMKELFGERRASLEKQIAEQMTATPSSSSDLVVLQPPEQSGRVKIESGSGAQGELATRTISTGTQSSNRLPALLTDVLGRRSELDAIIDALGRTRLLSLTGPGGTGKTVLAIAAGHAAAPTFADGAFFVPLAPINEAKLVASSIGEACGVRDIGGQPMSKTLQAFFSDRAVLLVVDNFEHVIDAAPLIAELLQACPRLHMLVTTRVVLNVQGERAFQVPPLPTPNLRKLPALHELRKNPAVELFCQRARDVSGFELSEDNAAIVARICAALDGLPLAIELAAARTKILPPEVLAEKLGDRLKLLTGGARNLPVRQRTLRGTIAWSYDLLGAEERELFERLAIFPGGFSLEAAEAVAPENADVLDILSSLVDKSLLLRASVESGEPRFAMLATVREFGLERLAESGRNESVARAHAEFFRRFAAEAGRRLYEADRKTWMGRVAAEQDNIRAAIRWSLAASEPDLAADIVGELWSWYTLAFNEGRELCDEIVRAFDGRPPTAALSKALYVGSVTAWAQFDILAMRTFADADLAVNAKLSDPRRAALAKISMALSLAGDRDAHARAVAALREAKDALERLGDPLSGLVGGYAGAFHMIAGEVDDARVWLTESEAFFERRGYVWQLNVVRMYLGMVDLYAGTPRDAEKRFASCIDAFEAHGDTIFLTLALVGASVALRQQGEKDRATASYARALSNCRDTGDLGNVPLCLEGIAWAAIASGKPERALWLLGAARAARASRQYGTGFDGLYDHMFPQSVEAASASVPEGRREELLREGAEASRDQVFASALED